MVEKSIHVVFDKFNDLSLQDVSKNVGLEEQMENLEISQDSQETREEAGEKGIQLEAMLHQMENQMESQMQDGSNLPKEWRYVHNHPTSLIIDDPSKG